MATVIDSNYYLLILIVKCSVHYIVCAYVWDIQCMKEGRKFPPLDNGLKRIQLAGLLRSRHLISFIPLFCRPIDRHATWPISQTAHNSTVGAH